MIRIPLKIRYSYDPFKRVYRELGTHRTITIEQFEALEKYESKVQSRGLIVALVSAVIATGFIIWGAL